MQTVYLLLFIRKLRGKINTHLIEKEVHQIVTFYHHLTIIFIFLQNYELGMYSTGVPYSMPATFR